MECFQSVAEAIVRHPAQVVVSSAALRIHRGRIVFEIAEPDERILVARLLVALLGTAKIACDRRTAGDEHEGHDPESKVTHGPHPTSAFAISRNGNGARWCIVQRSHPGNSMIAELRSSKTDCASVSKQPSFERPAKRVKEERPAGPVSLPGIMRRQSRR
jgi:hypothetical protein